MGRTLQAEPRGWGAGCGWCPRGGTRKGPLLSPLPEAEVGRRKVVTARRGEEGLLSPRRSRPPRLNRRRAPRAWEGTGGRGSPPPPCPVSTGATSLLITLGRSPPPSPRRSGAGTPLSDHEPLLAVSWLLLCPRPVPSRDELKAQEPPPPEWGPGRGHPSLPRQVAG